MTPLTSENMLDTGPAEAAEEDDGVFLFPLSPQQFRYWRLDREDPGNPALNGAFRHELNGTVDVTILEKAFNDLVERHEILRSTVREIDGEPRLAIAEHLKFRVNTRDLTGLPEAARAAELEAECTADARVRLDLERGPLFRVGFIRIEPEKAVLTMTLHHIVADGWSLGILTNELTQLYHAHIANKEAELPPLQIQFGDYASWLQDRLKSPDIERQTAYWKRHLANYHRLDMAPDVPQPEGVARATSLDARIIARDLPDDLITKLKDFSNQQGGTLFITALAACTAVLRAASGRKDIAIGTPFAARERPELERIVGPLLNYVVLRSRVGGDPTLRELETELQKTVLDAFANQEVPLGHVLSSLSKQGTPPPEPFYNVSFVSQRMYPDGASFTTDHAGLQMRSLPSITQGALYDLFFFLVEREYGWRLSLEYRTGIFSEARAQDLLSDLYTALCAICESPDARLSELSFASHPIGADAEASADEDEDGPFQIVASYAQERFWLLYCAAPDDTSFNVPVFQRISGPLDANLLERALQSLVSRHESLRTTFREIDGTLFQIIGEEQAFKLETTMLAPGAGLDERLGNLLRAEAAKPFDLEVGPLFRGTLVSLGEDGTDHLLALNLHHIICDGQSAGVLQKEMWAIYEALKERRPAGLAPLQIQYGDVAANQREWLDTPEAAAELEFWKRKLAAPLPVLDFPLDHAPNAAAPFRSANLSLTLDAHMVSSLKKLATAENATMFAVTAAAFAALLARYSNAEDILFGCPVANRTQETAGIIGPFAGPLAIRVDLKGEPSMRDCLNRTRDEVFDALANTQYPFERLATEIDARSVSGRKPLFQFYFLYQNAFVTACRIGELETTPVAAQGIGTPYEVQLALIERTSGVSASLEYNPALLDRKTVESILKDYVGILSHLLSEPEARLSTLPSPARRGHGLLSEAPAQPTTYVPPATDGERQLVEIWQRLLNRSPIGIRDDFFAIGGQSMLAARMLMEVTRATGVRLDLSLLAMHRTIETLAPYLKPNCGPRTASLIALQPLGSHRPLFCIHGGGGHVLHYADIAKVIPKDQPVYGLSAAELGDDDPPSVERLASLYIDEIRKVQPEGPYKICGYSFGGVVAFEMAAQLSAMGQVTDMLIILDAANRAYYRHMPLRDRLTYWTTFLSNRGSRYLDRIANGRWEELFYSVKSLAHKNADRLIWRVTGRHLPYSEAEKNLIVKTGEIFDAVAERYEPSPYYGRLLLFRSSARAAEFNHNPTLGWEQVARGGVEVITVPGDHLSMVKQPHVETLVAHIVKYQHSA